MQARLAQVIANHIRDRIIEGALGEGAKLPTESELIRTYSVSRSTIREAMKTLQAENIVEIRHGLGSYVASNTGITNDPLGLSFADQSRLLLDLMEVRILMEPNIAAMAAQRRTNEEVTQLEHILHQMVEKHRNGKDYHNTDYQFHITVAQCTHNGVLARIFPVVFEAVERGYVQTAHLEGSFSRAIDYHRRILDAIRDSNSEEARCLMQLHIEQTRQDIHAKMKGEIR